MSSRSDEASSGKALLDELASRDGTLVMTNPSSQVRASYRRAIWQAREHGLVPDGQRLRYTGRDRGNLRIWLAPALRGDFVDLDGRHFNVFELGRINILLGFTIAGYNRRRITAFCAAYNSDDPNAATAPVDLSDPDDDEARDIEDHAPSGGADPPDRSRCSDG